MSEKIGSFPARAVPGSYTLGVTSKGDPQVAVEFEVTSGERSGERFAWYGTFGEKAQARTLDSLRYAGWENDDLSEPVGLGNLDVNIQVEKDTWEGKETVRVAWVNPPGGGIAMKKVMTKEESKMFAARMMGAAVARRPAHTPKQTPPAPRAPVVDRGDDIPF